MITWLVVRAVMVPLSSDSVPAAFVAQVTHRLGGREPAPPHCFEFGHECIRIRHCHEL